MPVSKVVYNQDTLIDLTKDTVTKDALKKGFTAHQADGTMIIGEFIGDDYDEIDRILTAGLTDGYKHFRTTEPSSAQPILREELLSRHFRTTS